jgi:hypothetical protein
LWKPKISDARGEEEARISNRITTILDPVLAKNQLIEQREDNTEIHLRAKDGIHARYRKDSNFRQPEYIEREFQNSESSLKREETSQHRSLRWLTEAYCGR